MWILVIKFVLTPLLIASVSYAGRRWGPGVSGWLAALPLQSGPVSVLFVLQYGTEFAAQAAVGTLAGLVSVAAYCFVYCYIAQTRHWLLAITLAVAAFFAVTAALSTLPLPLIPTYLVTLLTLTLALRFIPIPRLDLPPAVPPAWDIPARMLTALVFVLLLTYAAEQLGPQLSGLLSPFPIFATILALFAHIQRGAPAAILSQRGILSGLYGFATFFLVVGLGLTVLPVAVTYALAVLAALAVNTVSLRFARHA